MLFLSMVALIGEPGFGQVPGTKLWEVTLGNHVYSSPAIGDDGTIYVGVSTAARGSGTVSTSGWVYAISPQGATNWVARTFGDVLGSPAIGVDGTIYAGAAYGHLYAFNPNGTTNWVFATGGLPYYSFIGGSPAIGADGTIYIVAQAGYYDSSMRYPNRLYAVRPNGTTNWVVSVNSAPNNQVNHVFFPSPAIGPDGTIYVVTRDQKLLAITPTGTTNWVFSIGAEIYSSPAIGPDGTIYLGADDYKLHAIHPRGFEKWSFRTGSYVESSAAITKDTIYIGSLDGLLYALDHNGVQRWRAYGEKWSASPAIGADGSIYLHGVALGGLFAFNSSGSNTWQLNLPPNDSLFFSSPAIGLDGTIYYGSGLSAVDSN